MIPSVPQQMQTDSRPIEDHERRPAPTLDALRAEIAAGLASGPPQAADAVFDRLETIYAANGL